VLTVHTADRVIEHYMKTSKASPKEQMKASAYYFKSAEVKKLFIAAPKG
jgi:hypothetical protein